MVFLEGETNQVFQSLRKIIQWDPSFFSDVCNNLNFLANKVPGFFKAFELNNSVLFLGKNAMLARILQV